MGITDNSGTTVTTYDYDSYGNTTLNGIDIGNERLFTGREYDSETGLYYNRARYYNPKLGRFISQDPIGQVDDVNLYAYVGNNPVNAVDRMGTEKNLIVGNLDSIRIIYEHGGVGHTHLQIGKDVYTYGTSGDFLTSRLKGIGSIIPNIVDKEITSRSIEEFLLFNKNLTIYNLKYTNKQKEQLNAFVNQSIESNEKYSLLGQNCSSFVQSGLISSGIDNGSDFGSFGGNIPFIYNGYLDELSKGNNNYIEKKYDYNIEKYSNIEQADIKNLIEKNYDVNVNYLNNISPYVK